MPVKDWELLTLNGPVFISVPYFKALEASQAAGMKYFYVIIYKNKIPHTGFYFQAIDLSFIRISSAVHIEPYGKFLNLVSDKLNRMLLRGKNNEIKWMLIGGNMYSSGNYGVVTAALDDAVKLLPDVTEKVIELLCKTGEISVSVFKDYLQNDDFFREYLVSCNYHRMLLDQVMLFDVRKEWKSFENYLDSMSSKYRLRATTVMKKVSEFELRELTRDDIVANKMVLDILYKAVLHKAPVQLVHPDINYIIQLKEKFGNYFKVKAWFHNNEPIAFFTSLLWNGHLDAHHIGFNYHYNKTHSLYQNILYQLIEEAINCKARILNYGRTAMEMKSTVGAYPVEYCSYIKLHSRLLNSLVKPFLPSQSPKNWILRNPYKD